MSKLLYIVLLAILIAFWLPRELAVAEPNIAPFIPSTRQIILGEATKYVIPPEKMLRVAQCESSMNPKAYNPRDVDGLPAYGLFQFKKTTFEYYASLAGIENPDIWSAKDQAQTTAYMLSIGKDQWGCK